MNSIGDRFKKYEQAYNIVLPMRLPIIIRLDGKAFHTLTKDLVKPYDFNFMSFMNLTANYCCENIQGAQIAYVQSDEISILVHNYKKLNSQAWFGNELQKMTSISASLASSYFSLQYNKLAQFDSRVLVLPEAEVCNYFIWRQQDWERNSIQLLAQSLFSPKQLHGKNCDVLVEMCRAKGKDWYDFSQSIKYGRSLIKRDYGFFLDMDIPKFQDDRDYIEQYLKTEE